MVETLVLPETVDKQTRYAALMPQVLSLIEGERDLIANFANVAAALSAGMGFFWVGFYRVIDDQLVLGPFQGPIACTRIAYGKGVCGAAWQQAQTLIVEDVHAFEGHIACSALSASEIVLPLIHAGEVVAVLDIDSDKRADFDQTDQRYLSQVMQALSATLDRSV